MIEVTENIGDELVIQFGMVSVINSALCHCRIPVVSNLKITNRGRAQSKPFRLSFHIPGYGSHWENNIEALGPGMSKFMPFVFLELHHDVLFEVRSSSPKTAILEVKGDGRLLLERRIKVLGLNEWPFDPSFRKTLACFVEPAHPAVHEIVRQALDHLVRKGAFNSCHSLIDHNAHQVAALIRAIYETARGLRMYYDLDPPRRSDHCQKIRSPGEVLMDPCSRQGRGTCIDLVLLLASCLENIHLQPLVIIRKTDREGLLHAVLGCWTYLAPRRKPVITDYRSVDAALKQGRMLALEATGFTAGKDLDFDQAVEEAQAGLSPASFEFALDVAAARRTVLPLEFPMTVGCIAIVRESEALARKEKSGELTPGHLLSAMIQYERGEGTVRDLLEAAGAKFSLDEPIRTNEVDAVIPKRTVHYSLCLNDAVTIAGRGKLVREEHLLYGILLSDSRKVDDLLHELGTNRGRVLRAVKSRLASDDFCAGQALLERLNQTNRFPVVAVRLIVVDTKGKVLITRRRPKQQYPGEWCLPGGKVEYGETIEEAAVRQLEEETALACTGLKFLFYQDSPPMEPGSVHCVNLYLKCNPTGTLKLNDEADDYAWIGPEDLPHYKNMAFRNDSGLERYWSELGDGEKPLAPSAPEPVNAL